MNNTYFTICKADQEQREHVLSQSAIKNNDTKKNAIIYVVINDNNRIIGSIIVVEQNTSTIIMGKCWYIAEIFVHQKHRKNGIATALFGEIKKEAELSNILYFWGHARPSLEASMFWLKQGVTMHPFGAMNDDINKPLLYGNYSHIFSYCVRRKSLYGGSCGVNIRAIVKDEMSALINKYIEDESKKKTFLSNKDELFGYVALGDNSDSKGVIIAFPHEMKAPFDSTYWVTNIYVDPRFRYQGIGRSLVWQLYQHAKEKEVIQLTSFTTEYDVGFWYELGFDIYFRGKNTQGVTLAAAMMRVK